MKYYEFRKNISNQFLRSKSAQKSHTHTLICARCLVLWLASILWLNAYQNKNRNDIFYWRLTFDADKYVKEMLCGFWISFIWLTEGNFFHELFHVSPYSKNDHLFGFNYLCWHQKMNIIYTVASDALWFQLLHLMKKTSGL